MNRIKRFIVFVGFILAGCGGGSESVPQQQQSQTQPVQTGDLYIGPEGGDLSLKFSPDTLPSWISTNGSGLKVNSLLECSNRKAEIKGGSNFVTVVQTSMIQCNEPDFASVSNWNLVDKTNLWWKEQSGLFFISPQSNWPRKRGVGQFKFEVKYGDCEGTDCTRLDGARDRSEIGITFERTGNDLLTWKPVNGRDYWYSFSFFVPKPYVEQGNQTGTSQTTSIHQIMTTFEMNGVREWYPMVMLGKEFNGPMVARTFPTSSPYKTYKLIEDNDFEGHWHDVMIRYRAGLSSGVLQIWVNGVLKVDYAERTLLNDISVIYAKFGIYRPSVSSNPVQTVYFDELRYGDSRIAIEPK